MLCKYRHNENNRVISYAIYEPKHIEKRSCFICVLLRNTMKIIKSFHMRYTYQSTLKKEVVSYASF